MLYRGKYLAVKNIFIDPNEEISLQYHNKRSEYWKITKGAGKVIIGNKEIKARIDSCFFVRKKEIHKIISGKTGITILEISFGDYDENDVVRLQDKYNRISR